MKEPGHLENIEPHKLAQHQSKLTGHLPFSDFVRVEELAFSSAANVDDESDEGSASPKSDVHYELAFGYDENRQAICSGHVKVNMGLQCQRCMNRVDHQVDSDFVFAFVKTDEQAAQLPRSYEPVMFDGYAVNLREALEDEILLALPAFPAHDDGDCELAVATASAESTNEKPSPFAGLTELLKK